MDTGAKKEPGRANPLLSANWLSWIFFWWMNPLFRTGYKRSLQVEDMYNVLPEDKSDACCERLEREWDRELLKTKVGGTPSLLRAIIRGFGYKLSLMGIIAFAEEGVKVLQPLMMGWMLQYFRPNTTMPTAEAYGWALGVGLCAVILGLCHHPYFFLVTRIGMQIRVATCGLIFKKSLRLSNAALGKTTTGQIVNLMSNDVNRFDNAVLFLHYLWIAPLQAVGVLVILWKSLGVATLAGYALLILLIPLQGFMGKLFSKLRHKVAVQTDERVRLMNEILVGMRVIKMYCWENMFTKLVESVRKAEILKVRNAGYAKASSYAPFFSSAKLIAYLTFLAYILNGSALNAEVVFVALAMYNPVRLTLTLFVPFAITLSSEALITIKRVQELLLLEELEQVGAVVRPLAGWKPGTCRVTALNLTASWNKDSKQVATLQNVSVEAGSGELLAVIGPVGSGKSSLLMAVLGELSLTQGSVKVSGRLAYASQQPWVFSGSVRQNITFGQDFNKALYQKVVYASALVKDLEILVDGDQTLVGERGVSLSGGQKARISLARALYADADIYLLDDPLSAVDTAVGRHIFDKCICGLLKSKPRILVTHQLQYLQRADRILILKEGQMLDVGTFEELSAHGVDFAALMKQHEAEEDIISAQSLPLVSVHRGQHTESTHSLGDMIAGPGTLCKPYSHSMEDHALQPDSYLSKSLDHSLVSYLTEAPDYQTQLLSRSVDLLNSPRENNIHAKSALLGKDHHVKHDGAPGHLTIAQDDSENELRKRGPFVNKSLQKVLSSCKSVSLAQSMDSMSHAPGAGSMISLGSLDQEINADYVAPMQTEEDRAAGSVTIKVYIKYFTMGTGVLGLVLFVVFNILAQGTYILADWWLSHWANMEELHQTQSMLHQSLLDAGYNQTNVTIPDVDTFTYLGIFTGITLSIVVLGFVRALQTFHMLVYAAQQLHNNMFAAVIRSPILFFDTNPIGRILNRFSKDMGQVDETLPVTMYDFMQCFLMIIGILVVGAGVNPWVLLVVLPMGVLFVYLRRYYLHTSRDIKRLEGTTRSPVFSHISATLQGLQTLRSYGKVDKFVEEFHVHQDLHTAAWYLFLSTSRWLAVRLDIMCSTFVLVVSLTCVMAASGLNPGLVGLTLTYAMSLMGLFQWGVRQSAEVENQMTSVERIMEYAALPAEAALVSAAAKKPAESWPQYGIITVEDVSFAYSEGAAPVLENLRFCIRATEKVGIVGRTGAGKSSLIAMLFRLAEPQGVLTIDGVQLADIGLHDLRRAISIIPQDPVLFTGTVHRNLDPFNQHADAALWRALEEVQLKSAIEDLPGQLDAKISEGGSNFSVGQRQLICLARAILKSNRILVIDEATANVDPRTDAMIQQTIREKFQACTVLTIAHRLHTIMDSHRVMVLDAGRLCEFEPPHLLLQNTASLFHQMAAQTGHAELQHLKAVAKEAYLSNHDNIEPEVDVGNSIGIPHYPETTATEDVQIRVPGEDVAGEEDSLMGRDANV